MPARNLDPARIKDSRAGGSSSRGSSRASKLNPSTGGTFYASNQKMGQTARIENNNSSLLPDNKSQGPRNNSRNSARTQQKRDEPPTPTPAELASPSPTIASPVQVKNPTGLSAPPDAGFELQADKSDSDSWGMPTTQPKIEKPKPLGGFMDDSQAQPIAPNAVNSAQNDLDISEDYF